MPAATELLIRTDTLRAILEQEPEVKLRLQETAVAKIAEELLRKAKNMSVAQFTAQMEATVNKAMQEANNNLISKYRFPEEAKTIIRDIAREAVTSYANAELTRLQTSISSYFAAKQKESDERIEQIVTEAIVRMRPVIRQQAREEFITVLETAKGIGA